ncbi:hypothetical protein PybrP1_007174, partial [[Pythium] brassicae (nom. inval.)]
VMESRMPHEGDTSAEHGQVDGAASTKRRRMQQLIQKSIVMSAEREAAASSSSSSSSTAASGALAQASASSSKGSRIITSAAASSSSPAAPRPKHQKWAPEDDRKLRELVRRLGNDQWAAVAAHFPGRDRKRCRERFVNHADPELRQRAWTRQEDAELQAQQRALGRRWAAIARLMRGRSPEDVKNRCLQLGASRAAPTSDVAVRVNGQEKGDNERCRDAASAMERESYLVERESPARAAPIHWTTTEADRLRALVATHGATNWLFLASHLPGRTDQQCMQQWFQVLDPAVVKGKGSWSAAEDALLALKVATLGPKWTQISRLLPGRVGKQCRERYLNHLDPSINKTPWTLEEDARLADACEKHGRRWSLIMTQFPGRSENAVKNRCYALARRKLLSYSSNATSSSRSANS